MTPTIAPDLQQNILVTIYLLFSHNYIAFAYFIYVLGWFFIYLAIFYGAIKIKHENSGKKRNG